MNRKLNVSVLSILPTCTFEPASPRVEPAAIGTRLTQQEVRVLAARGGWRVQTRSSLRASDLRVQKPANVCR
jgi:hypothetical protein